MAPTDFPRLTDGNVVIRLSSDTEFVLDSHTLALHSAYFAASLSSRWNGNQSNLTGSGQHWQYELQFDDTNTGLLAKIDPSKSAFSGSQGANTDDANAKSTETEATVTGQTLQKERTEVIEAHKQLFAAIYHIQPAFLQYEFSTAIDFIKQLARTAAAYDSEHTIDAYINAYLLSHQRELLSLHATKSLALAKEVKSKWLFEEAATQLICSHKEYYEEGREGLRELGMLDLFEKKRQDFCSSLTMCELALFKIVPEKGSNSKWVDVDYGDVATAYFRHWLNHQLNSGLGSSLNDGYASLYRVLNRVSKVFNRDDMQRYLQKVGFSYMDQIKEIERHLNDIVQKAAVVVKPLLNDVAKRQDKTLGDRQALRLITIEGAEFPWALEAGSQEVGPHV